MAPVYADHPFPLITTPGFHAKSRDPTAPLDPFDYCATEMAHVHNFLFRGLNSIYLQAPHIVPSDHKPFCQYILGWFTVLQHHHHGEETDFFPWVEKMSGQPGLMDRNVEQHRVFHDGIENLGKYAENVIAGTEKYEGGKVVQMIDEFGPALAEHLADEIPTIVDLRRFGDKCASLGDMFDKEGEKVMKQMGLYSLAWCFTNIDVHYENDLWPNFPPAPAPVKFISRTLLWFLWRDSYKFGSVDRKGNLKPLYAVPKDEEKTSN